MKLNSILLGLGILGSAAAIAALEHRATRHSRNDTARLLEESEAKRMAIRAIQDQAEEARRELNERSEQVAALEQLTTARASVTGSEPLPLRDAAWQPDVPYIDLPKSNLKGIQTLVLDADDEITTEASALYALTDEERSAVRDLYRTMKARYEQLERDHLVQTNLHTARAASQPGEKVSFVILPFPDEADALKTEWREKLQQFVGATRAELIAERVTNSPHMQLMMRRGNSSKRNDYMRLFTRGQNWLSPHPRVTHITFFGGSETSLPGYYTESGSGGTPRGDKWQIPERWRHLITEDMLPAR